MKGSMRADRGNTLVLVLATISIIVIPLAYFFCTVGMLNLYRQRTQDVVDGAALLAASDLSRVVINDPNFGFVALSNYPASGNATRADDGEPLPVLGINTLIGTLRQNTIVAHELANEAMMNAVDLDREYCQTTIKELNAAMLASLDSSGTKKCLDPNGKAVYTTKDVEKFLAEHLPSDEKLVSVELRLGTLSKGGTSATAVPQPQQLAQMQSSMSRLGGYIPFIDIPAVGRSFIFAGLGGAPCIVPASDFLPAKPKQVSSIILVECVVARGSTSIKCAACCQPGCMPDTAAGGILSVRSSVEPVQGIQYLGELLKGNLQDQQISKYEVVEGDYPVDSHSRIEPSEDDISRSSSEVAEHLYYWLRGWHLKPRIDAVLALVNEPFKFRSNEISGYSFRDDGSVQYRNLSQDDSALGISSDRQSITMINTSIVGGPSPVIVLRDNVQNLGTIYGGKHAGQPQAVRQRGLFNKSGLALDIEIGGIRPSSAALDVSRMRRLLR